MNAYKPSGFQSGAATQIKSNRDREHEAVLRVTANLMSSDRGKSKDYGRFVNAVYKNRQLWGILTTDLLAKENRLPNQLKGQLLYLAEFVRHHSSKVLSDGASIKPLVDVNRAILNGLSRSEANT